MSGSIDSCLQSLTAYLDAMNNEEGTCVDVNNFWDLFMLDVVCKTLVSIQVETYGRAKGELELRAKKLASFPLSKVMTFSLLPEFILRWFGISMNVSEGMEYMIKVLTSVLDQRRQSETTTQETGRRNKRTKDLIDILLNARVDDLGIMQGGFTEAEMTGNMIQFFIGRFETTSGTLAAALHVLATHPHVQERLRQEILISFIQEVLRMYPHIVRFDRLCNADITLHLDGREVRIEAGSKVRLPIT